MQWYKFIYLLLGGLFLFIVIAFGLFLLKTYRESKVFVAAQSNLEIHLNKAKDELKMQEDYIKRFNNDPLFFEWVIRKRIGFVEANEIVFRFNNEGTSKNNFQ